MLNQKKKIIYIVVISLCIIGSLLVFKFGMNTSGTVPAVDFSATPSNNAPSDNQLPTQTQAHFTVSDLSAPEFPPVAVFPLNEKFNQNVLQSSAYKSLEDYELLTIDKEKELGKDNPFVE